jgi:hypothetical protein
MRLVLRTLRERDMFSRMFRFNRGSSCHLSSSVEDVRCFPHIKPRSDHIAAREDLQGRWDTDLGRSGHKAQIDIVRHVLLPLARVSGRENDHLGRLHAESAVIRDKASYIATRISPSGQQLRYLRHLRHRLMPRYRAIVDVQRYKDLSYTLCHNVMRFRYKSHSDL